MTDEQKPTSSLAKQMETAREWLAQQEPELARVLPKGMTPQRFARVALTAVLRNPEIAACTRASFVLAIMEAAALGLEPDSQSGLAYLVPYKRHVQLIVGYRGLIQLAYRHPRVSEIAAEAVYDKDALEITLGIAPKLKHVPAFGIGGRGEFIGAYAWARISGGGRPFVYMEKAEIEEHRERSASKGRGPWVTDYIAMAKKTPVRALAKFIPLSPSLMQAIASEADPEQERPAPPLPSGENIDAMLEGIAGEHDGQVEQA
jgi:recombination protein RecT